MSYQQPSFGQAPPAGANHPYPPPQGYGHPTSYGYPQQTNGYPPLPPPQYPPQHPGYNHSAGYPQNGYGAPPPPPPPPPPPQSQSFNNGVPMPENDLYDEDNDKIKPDMPASIRNGFVRKVYGILFVQLLITFGIVAGVSFWPEARVWFRENYWISIVAMVAGMAIICALTCVQSLARQVPANFILLAAASLSFGLMLSFITAQFDTDLVFIAMGVTLALVVGLTLFACFICIDFTGCGPFLFVALLAVMMFGLLALLFQTRVAHMAYACLGALVMSLYIVFDTQQIVGGKHRKYVYSIDDYIFAVVTLYMDILNLFMCILSIVGITND